MPQLSVETFISQYIWLIIVLWGFYWLVVTQILPSFSLIAKARQTYEKTTRKTGGAVITGSKKPITVIKGGVSSNNNYNNNFNKAKTAWIKKIGK